MLVLDTNVAFQNATTQYQNFDMDSIVKFGTSFFAANSSGLYKIDSTTKMFEEDRESDESIDSYFVTATMDFGISSNKRLRAVYIGYESDGDLTLTVSTELCDAEDFILPTITDNQHARKVNMHGSLYGRYWEFKISGRGVNFSVDEIKVLPVVRSHGVNQN